MDNIKKSAANRFYARVAARRAEARLVVVGREEVERATIVGTKGIIVLNDSHVVTTSG